MEGSGVTPVRAFQDLAIEVTRDTDDFAATGVRLLNSFRGA